MSEIISDSAFTNIDLTSNLGLNMISRNSRIQHIGDGTMKLESLSGSLLFRTTWNSGSESIKFQSSYGGILLNAGKLVSIQTSDSINGIAIGTIGNIPIFIGNQYNSHGVIIKSNLTISGNLTVFGDTVQNNVSTYNVEDPLIILGNGQLTPNYDLGFVGVRGSSINVAFFWDESVDKFVCAKTDSIGDATQIVIDSYADIIVGNLNASEVSATTLTGIISTSSQTNITSIGTLNSLLMAGNIDLNNNDIINTSTIYTSAINPTNSTIIVNLNSSQSEALIIKEGVYDYLVFDTLNHKITTDKPFNIGNGFSIVNTIVLSSADELNILNGANLTTEELNILSGLTASTTELNILDGATITVAELNILDGLTASTTELNILDGATITVAELNILAGLTSSTTELNILDGATITVAELNILDGLTASTTELNILDGATITVAELNILDGATITVAELNILDGLTASTTELNYVDITTIGIAQASKALIVNEDVNISGINSLSATILEGTLNTVDQPNITSVGILSVPSSVSILGDTTSGGKLILKESTAQGTNHIIIQAPSSLLSNYRLVLPINDGDASQFLQTNGNGILTWAGITSGITAIASASDVNISMPSDNQLLAYDFASSKWDNVSNITVSDITASGTVDLSGATLTLANDQISGDKINGGTIGSITITALSDHLSLGDNNITNVGNISLDSISADSNDINISLTDNRATALTIKEGVNTYMTFTTTNGSEGISLGHNLNLGTNNITNAGTISADTYIRVDGTSTVGGKLVLVEGTNNGAHTVIIKAPNSISASYTLTLPSDDGTSNQYLKTDGNGGLSWGTPSSGSSGYSRTVINSGAYVVQTGDDIIAVRYTVSGTVLITLPNIGVLGEAQFRIVDEGGYSSINNITVAYAVGDLLLGLDGSANTYIINSDYGSIRLYNDGVNKWFITN